MQADTITGLAIAAGIIMAGLTWFGWELLENVAWARNERHQRVKQQLAAQALAEKQRKADQAKEGGEGKNK